MYFSAIRGMKVDLLATVGFHDLIVDQDSVDPQQDDYILVSGRMSIREITWIEVSICADMHGVRLYKGCDLAVYRISLCRNALTAFEGLNR